MVPRDGKKNTRRIFDQGQLERYTQEAIRDARLDSGRSAGHPRLGDPNHSVLGSLKEPTDKQGCDRSP
jgi:hypothetical protein